MTNAYCREKPVSVQVQHPEELKHQLSMAEFTGQVGTP